MDKEGKKAIGDFVTIERASPGERGMVTCHEGKVSTVGSSYLLDDFARYNVEMRGRDGAVYYTFSGDKCQSTIMCSSHCKGQTEFTIYNGFGNRCGEFYRIQDEKSKNVAEDSDCYSLTFPEAANVDDRILLLAGMIYIEVTLFEKEGE